MKQMRHNLDVCVWFQREQRGERRGRYDARQHILCHRRVLEAWIRWISSCASIPEKYLQVCPPASCNSDSDSSSQNVVNVFDGGGC